MIMSIDILYNEIITNEKFTLLYNGNATEEQLKLFALDIYNQSLEDAANIAADAIRKNEDPINAILSLKKQ